MNASAAMGLIPQKRVPFKSEAEMLGQGWLGQGGGRGLSALFSWVNRGVLLGSGAGTVALVASCPCITHQFNTMCWAPTMHQILPKALQKSIEKDRWGESFLQLDLLLASNITSFFSEHTHLFSPASCFLWTFPPASYRFPWTSWSCVLSPPTVSNLLQEEPVAQKLSQLLGYIPLDISALLSQRP